MTFFKYLPGVSQRRDVVLYGTPPLGRNIRLAFGLSRSHRRRNGHPLLRYLWTCVYLFCGYASYQLGSFEPPKWPCPVCLVRVIWGVLTIGARPYRIYHPSWDVLPPAASPPGLCSAILLSVRPPPPSCLQLQPPWHPQHLPLPNLTPWPLSPSNTLCLYLAYWVTPMRRTRMPPPRGEESWSVWFVADSPRT